MSVNRILGQQFNNGLSCHVTEFGGIGNADIAKAVIQGRYPAHGFALNHASDMLLYVLSGSGSLVLHDEEYQLHPTNVIQVDKETPYYYEGNGLEILIMCSPAWNADQYEQID